MPRVLDLPVTVTRYEPGHITVRLGAPAPAGSALVVSENYYPGWRAVSGRRELNVGRANFTLIGVELPAGAAEVDLTFHSASYQRGKLITCVAIGASLLLIVGGLAAGGRRRA